MQRRTALVLALLLPVQIIFLQVLKGYPEIVEKYYSLGFYPYLSATSRYLFGWIPFSIGDIFYLLIGILAFRWLYKNFRRISREPFWFFTDIVATFSVVYLMFHILWGFNYYRLPLHRSLNLQSDYTYNELLRTTELFIEKSNALHRQLGYADSLRIDLPFTQKQMFEKSLNGYQNLQQEYPQLTYSPKSIKKSTWSIGLSYMGYSGYLNPFSGEAQVNGLVKTYKFPVVACHEEAHQIGFAAENEANFIATLATLHNEDPYIQYAGYIFTLRYLINEVARNDMEQYCIYEQQINPGIMASYLEARQFWAQFNTPFETFSSIFWDNFLKANNQTHGIRSYNYMVALVVNYYEDRSL